MPKYGKVELTESAKKKLPAAKKAKEERNKKGSLGNVRDRKTSQGMQMNKIMRQIKTSRGK